MAPEVFTIRRPKSGASAPLLISSPHTGTFVPPEIQAELLAEPARTLPDTDWEVDSLYQFAVAAFGATQIRANYSRYVIDLNRAESGPPLYGDGRLETGLIPATTSNGEALYQSESLTKKSQTDTERERRLARYYRPYHDALAQELGRLRAQHRHVLLLEAHSIQPFLPRVSPKPFPDIILGDQNRSTAHPSLGDTAWKILAGSTFQCTDNQPFRGGFITRHYGRPDQGVHAIQIEMSQAIYWRGGRVDPGLQKPLETLISDLVENLLAKLGEFP